MLFIFTRVCVWVLVWVYYALGIYMAITRQPHDVQGSVQFCTSVGSPRSMGNPCRQRMLVDGIKRSRGDGVRCNVCYVQRSAIAATLGERRLICILVLWVVVGVVWSPGIVRLEMQHKRNEAKQCAARVCSESCESCTRHHFCKARFWRMVVPRAYLRNSGPSGVVRAYVPVQGQLLSRGHVCLQW